VVLARERYQRPARVVLNARGIDDGELAGSEALAGDEVEHLEGGRRRGLIIFVIGDEPPAMVGGEHLGRLKVFASEARLARAARADEHDQRELRNGELLHDAAACRAASEKTPAASALRARIEFSDGQHADAVAKAGRHLDCPIQKLRPRPFEAMVGVAKLAGGKVLELHVIFGVRSRNHDRAGPRKLEHDPLQGPEPRRLHVLDDLDQRGGVVAGEALVSVGERALKQPEALPLLRRHLVGVQTRLGDREYAGRDIDAHHARERLVAQQAPEQLALSTPEVDDGARSGLAQAAGDSLETQVVQAQFLLAGLLDQRTVLVCLGGIGALFAQELVESAPRQVLAMLEIAMCDRILLRMAREPALALGEQLFDLVFPDPVVFVVVEHGISTYRWDRRSWRRTRALRRTSKYGLSPHSGNSGSSGRRLA
jgi:hypothetical protein